MRRRFLVLLILVAAAVGLVYWVVNKKGGQQPAGVEIAEIERDLDSLNEGTPEGDLEELTRITSSL